MSLDEISKLSPPLQPSSRSAYRRTAGSPSRSISLSMFETVSMTAGSDCAATSGRSGSFTIDTAPLIRALSAVVRCIRITYAQSESEGKIMDSPRRPPYVRPTICR